MEIWKEIEGYEGIYQVSNLGRVINVKSNKILKGGNQNGYRLIFLSLNGKSKKYTIHRLVMQTFIGLSKLDVNHKNGIKDDNRLENLEYCTKSENIQHGWDTGLIKVSENNFFKTKHPVKGLFGKEHYLSKKVNQYDLQGKFIKTWHSLSDVYRKLKILQNTISYVCSGKRKTAGGFKWKYT